MLQKGAVKESAPEVKHQIKQQPGNQDESNHKHLYPKNFPLSCILVLGQTSEAEANLPPIIPNSLDHTTQQFPHPLGEKIHRRASKCRQRLA